MKERIAAIIREVFNDPELLIVDSTSPADILAWDSLNHITLIVRVEEEFDVSFTTAEIGALTSVGELARVLGTKMQ